MDKQPPAPNSFSDWVEQAALCLAGHSDSPRLDAEILLAAALEKPRSHVIAWPDKPLEGEALQRFKDWLARREAGEPVAHILGRREFWSLPLKVTADTLIPRPDTEILVEEVLARLPADRPTRLLDLGCGSGAIALAVKSERPLATVVATDASATALAVARQNAADLGLEVEFREGRWWDTIGTEVFDIVVSNPPYVRDGDPHLEQGDLRFEPRNALVAGKDGLDDIRAIIAEAGSHLEPGGWLLFEHGHDQAAPVRELLAAAGFDDVSSVTDLGGNERVTGGRNT